MAEVGKVKISNLPLASSVSDNDAMLIVQNGAAKRVMPSLMKGKQGDKGDEGKTGQGFAYKWDGTSLVLGTIAVGSSIIKWGEGVNLKGEQGDEGLTGSGSYVEQSGTKVRFGQSAVGQTSVTWGEYIQLRGSDAIYQWDGTSLKMGTRTYTVDGSTEEYSAGVDLKGATGQGLSYRWLGTSLQLGFIPAGGSETTWGISVDLKGEQGLRGVHGTDLEYVWEGTSLKLGRITYREDGTMTLVYSDPVNLQGNRGEQGLQPAMQMGDVITLNPEETASATFVKDGITADGADIYKLNLSIPRGMAGKEGMPRIPSAVLSLKSESTSDEIFAAWGGKEAMVAVGTSFLAGEKSNCLMSGNATLYFAYTDADNFQLEMLFRLEGKENQYDHRVVGGVASLTVTTYDNVHVNNASTMEKGKQYAFEPDTDGSASGVMKEVTVITQEEKDKINGTYSKAEIDNTFATKANTYTKDETYTKEEVEAKIPTLVDAYPKTESDERYPLKVEVLGCIPDNLITILDELRESISLSENNYNTLLSLIGDKTQLAYHGSADINYTNAAVLIDNSNSNEIVIYIGGIGVIAGYLQFVDGFTITKESREVAENYFSSTMTNGDGTIELSLHSNNAGTTTIILKTNGTGFKFLSDDGTYKEIDTSSLAAKSDVYTKTQADEKFALLSKQPYRIDSPMSLLNLETQSGYPIEMITRCLGETLESFLNNGHYLNCYFPQYIARVQQKTYYDSSDVFHFRVLFTFVESDYIKDITIDQARGSETCDITVVKKQLVTNILAISESNYANLSSKDSSTLYLVY